MIFRALDWKLRHKLACAPAEQGAAGDGEGNVQIEGNVTVNFSYHEAGEHKQALVKLVTLKLDNPLFYFFNVTRCAEKLYYKRRKDAERSESKEKKRQRRKRNRSSSEDDIEEEERRKGKKNKSKLEGCEREGKDDENFDEFMEGMFPGKARPRAAATAKGLTFLALAAAFAQQLFLLHLHSATT
ncbi:hypothetical protein YC2023_044038 [Brassica napus]